MKIKQKFRKVMATLLSVAMVMTLCVGLNFGAVTASAADGGVITSAEIKINWNKIPKLVAGDSAMEPVTGTGSSEDMAQITGEGFSYMYGFAVYTGNASFNGWEGLDSTYLLTSTDKYAFVVELSAETDYEFSESFKFTGANSSNCTQLYYSGDSMAYICELGTLGDIEDNQGDVPGGSTGEGITFNFASAGGTTGTMESVTLSAEAEIYTLPTPTFTADANRDFYLWEVVKEDGTIKGVYPSNGNIELNGDSKTYTATAYYGYAATITGVIDDDDVTFISETMIPGKQLLSPEFSSSPNPNLGEGNGIIINTTLSPAPQITATNATITFNSSNEDNGTYTYFYLATNITGPVTATAEAGESEEVSTYTITLDASKFTGSYIIGWGNDINGEQQYLRHGGTIEIPTDGTVVISATEAFTAVADSATVGELTEGEGFDRIISNFTKDTTIVINPDPSEEETTYNVKLDCTNYTETRVDLYTYDVVDGDWKNREYTSTNSGTITVSETGFARVFVYGGEFTVTAEGAVVGEIIDTGEEGSYCEITNFTRDTTVVVNAVTGDSGNTGDITNDTNPEENECNADLDLPDAKIEDVIDLTTEDEDAIANGEDISIILEVENADDTVDDGDKTATEDALTADMKVGMYLDINLLKKIGNNNPTAITETKQPITITFVVPDKLINTDTSKTRTYKIIRVHNGTATVLDCSFNPATKTASFATDKFSSYAIAYVDTIDSSNNSGSTGGNSGGNTTPTTRPNYPTVVIKPTTPEKDDDKDNDYEGEDVSSEANVVLDETMLETGSASESDVTVYITFTMFTLSVAYAIFKKKKHE